MIVAFTGSAQKLTAAQEDVIGRRLSELPPGTLVVTGGCIGVDAFVARTARLFDMCVITILPENRSKVDPSWKRWCNVWEDEPRDYRARNTRMVELCSLLIGYPETDTNGTDRGSGSWMTIRIAQRRLRQVEVYPLDEIK